MAMLEHPANGCAVGTLMRVRNFFTPALMYGWKNSTRFPITILVTRMIPS
jgi:hypothetical protein